MAPTYITGFDDGAAAQAALRFTRRLARDAGANVIAAYVYPEVRPVPTPYVPPVLVAHDAHVAAAARDAAQRVVSRLPSDVEAFAIAGASVPHELNRLARQVDGALLAVGASQRGSIGRLLGGRIGERIVHGAPCPVLVVPEVSTDPVVRSIAVAYDGGEQSRRALRAAAALAERCSARLVLIGVSDPPPGECIPHMADHELERAITKPVRTLIERPAARLLAQGFDVSIRLPTGNAPRAIVAACAEGVDLLVVGSRGYGPMRGALIGSVSRHLVDHAPCPVLVVARHAVLGLVADEAPVPVTGILGVPAANSLEQSG